MINEIKKREIEVMLDEYGRDLEAYRKWLEDWRQKQRRFRCQRGQDEPNNESHP